MYQNTTTAKTSCLWLALALALALFCLPHITYGQQGPEVGYAFPPGVIAGETTQITLGGYDWTPDMQFLVRNPRVKLEITSEPGPMKVPPPPYWFGPKARGPAMLIPREVRAKITVPADLAGQLIEWQVANANGASSVGKIAVSAGELRTIDDESQEAVAVSELPITVNGRLLGLEEIDRYQIRRKTAGLVTCRVVSGRIGSPIQPIIRVHDANGKRVAEAFETRGRDLLLTFLVEADQHYTISLHDLDFRGNWAHTYQLHLTPGPRVVAALPSAGKPGSAQDIKFIGYGIKSGQPILEAITRKVKFPDAPAGQTFEYELNSDHGSARFSLGFSEYVETHEATCKGKLPALPVAVSGTLDSRRAIDTYKATWIKGQVIDIEATATNPEELLDTALSVSNAEGKQLSSNDDAGGTTNARIQFKVPADGEYVIAVNDMANRSGSSGATYRLAVTLAQPSFDVTVPTQLSLPVGGKATLKITPIRSSGFKDDIAISIEGLPKEVSFPEQQIITAKKKNIAIPINVETQSSTQAFFATVIARGNIGEQAIERRHQVLFARTMKPRAKVTPVDRDGGRTVHRGTTYPADVIVERLEGFEGPVVLQMAAKQGRHRQGITSSDVLVPAGLTHTEFPVFCPEWLETDRTSRMVVNAITVIADPTGEQRYLSNKMDGRITMSLEGALMKVSAPQRLIVTTPGATIRVPISIARSPKLQESVKLSLDTNDVVTVNESIADVAVGQTDVIVPIKVDPDARGVRTITIRGTAIQAGKYAVVSQSSFRLSIEPPK